MERIELRAPVAGIVVDVRIDFCQVGGAVERRGLDIEALAAAIEPINRVNDASRASGGTVEFLQSVYDVVVPRECIGSYDPLRARWP